VLTGTGSTTETYDANGNRTISGYSTTTGNQLSTDGTWTYAYDAEGNETSKTITATGEKWTYSYDERNELIKAEHISTTGGAIDKRDTYKYDALGNRIEADVDADGDGGGAAVITKFALDGWKASNSHLMGNANWDVWGDLTSTSSLTTRYLRGDAVDQLFAELAYNGSTFTPSWTLTDRLGSVRDIVNNSATSQDSITYDMFGKITGENTPTNRGRYAWTGRELDVETGLQYNRARYYDSNTGRWLSQDPLGFDAGDSNLYRYVKNRPTVATDPSGFQGAVVPTTQVIEGNKYGQWRIKQENTNGTETTEYQSDVGITFSPNAATVNSTEIAFVQIVRLTYVNPIPTPRERWCMIKGDPSSPNVQALRKKFYDVHVPMDSIGAAKKARMTPDYWFVDRNLGKKFGWYAYNDDGTPNLEIVSPGKSPDPLAPAILTDIPAWNKPNLRAQFETFAISKSGKDPGHIYGGISWGFVVNEDLEVTSLPRMFLPTPTAEFNAAVKAWNDQAAGLKKVKSADSQEPLGPFFGP
jgi:RHS repeat-associated protein